LYKYCVEGYHTFLPLSHSELLKTAKYRVVVVVRSALVALAKIRPDLMHLAVQTIWIQLDLGTKISAYSSQQQQQQTSTKGKTTRFLIGGIYREWSDLPREYTALARIKDQLQAAASEVDNIIFAGEVNLDTARRCNMRYGRRCLMLAHDNAIAEANMRYLTTGFTYRPHGQRKREDGEVRGHESVLDHVCVTKELEATMSVLSDATTDHSPVVAAVKVSAVAPATKSMKRRNFKALERLALLQGLETWPWSDVYGIRDPDKVLDFVTRGIVNSLDQAAPVKSITTPLLAPGHPIPNGQEGLPRPRPKVQGRQEQGHRVGQAGQGGIEPGQAGRVGKLARGAMGDSKRGGQQASPASADLGHEDGWHNHGGKPQGRQRGQHILRGESVENSNWEGSPKHHSKGRYDLQGWRLGEKNKFFSFANAGQISKVFAGLKTTSALGRDGISVSVLKMGSNVLAGLVSHLVNMSLSAGVFPLTFKTAITHPVYKGSGNARNDPASYRPVAILCALSKVLETVAKEDLEAHMAANNILPTSQHGFRRGRSCTTALATAHAAWVTAKAKGKVVAVVGLDLSGAIDTVGREDLRPKMEAMGIRGKSLKWFKSYLTDARQRVVWDGQVSDVIDVEYGVRQGSLLGPVLYLLHASDLTLALVIRDSDGDSSYVDDTAVWVVAGDHEEARHELQRLVNVMVDFTKTNGLALNGAKTPVMVGGKGKPPPPPHAHHQRRRQGGQAR
jgi:hypothetical protein